MQPTLTLTHLHTEQDLHTHQALMQKVFPLHQSFRPHLADFPSYWALMTQIFIDRGHLLIAQDPAHNILGLALYRMHHNTYQHKLFFLEDLVVDEQHRGNHIGSQLLAECERIARAQGCHYLSLDSGTARTRAHKFYFVHGLVADCFHFSKQLMSTDRD